jgi:hypothetical protein
MGLFNKQRNEVMRELGRLAEMEESVDSENAESVEQKELYTQISTQADQCVELIDAYLPRVPHSDLGDWRQARQTTAKKALAYHAASGGWAKPPG